MLEYRLSAERIDAHGSLARCKDGTIALDTDLAGRPDAFNPAELLLAAVAACMIKGIERVTPLLNFSLRTVEVRLHGARQDSPPKMVPIDYEIIIDTDEDDRRLELLHTNIRKFGTIYNTVAASTELSGRILRRTSRDGPVEASSDWCAVSAPRHTAPQSHDPDGGCGTQI